VLNADDIKLAEQRRLAWRCKRGMLELDIVLARFIEEGFDKMTVDDLQAFDALLGFPDKEFWRLIQTPSAHSDANMQRILNKIKVTNNPL
jgi:antitoxin CptB